MRVSSVLPAFRMSSIKQSNLTTPNVVKENSVSATGGVYVTFTGADKNIHQFASWAPENKRYNSKMYNAGGLAVVSYEGPASWRLHENADARDFSPYHSYDNADGGVKVVKLQKDKYGNWLTSYHQSEFIHAGQNESLESIGKRIGLKKGETLSYVMQERPDAKGMSKIIRLVDTGVSGSFKRPSADSITELEEVSYRLFRAPDIEDTVEIEKNKIRNKVLNEVKKPFVAKAKEQAESLFKDAMQQAIEQDKKDTAVRRREAEIINKKSPLVNLVVEDFTYQQDKVKAKIAAEIERILELPENSNEIARLYEDKLATPEIVDQLKKIDLKAAPEVAERNAAYFIHTKDLARLEKAYGAVTSAYSTYGTYGTYGTVGSDGMKAFCTNTAYADSNRAFVKILPQLNSKKHGNYNPANLWLHDRPAFMVMNAVANESHFGNDYYTGIKAHGTFHNPGRDYQGAESNPFDFFRMVASEEDVAKLLRHPQVEQLRELERQWGHFPEGQKFESERFVNQIMRPFMADFLDDFHDAKTDLRTFNISMAPVAGTKTNPDNFTAGTVSVNYGKEMKSLATPDIAQFMTKKLSEIKTIDITNGSTPANLRLNDPTADFCQSGEINGLTKAKAGFTTYEYKPVIKDGQLVSDNILEVLAAKKSNTKWLLDSIGSAFETRGQKGVIDMFFSQKQISDFGATVIGHLSSYKEGDMLFMGWGRPDRQKGYPSTFQAFLEFLKDPNVSKETKQHTKLVVGAGVWQDGARDYEWVKDIIRQIEELDGGIYKGNACYVNGFFPNRLVGCATFSDFTSRFEPCGITPLESFASGTPVVSTRTGGAPDFVGATRGYLTENPYLRSVEELNIPADKLKNLYGEELGNAIDAERMFANASEVRECMIAATSDYSLPAAEGKLSKYTTMARDAISQKMDWHENSAYNGGKSANKRYMTEVFEVDKGFAARSTERMKRLVSGEFGIADRLSEGARQLRNKWTKMIIFTGLGIAALGTAACMYLKKNKKAEHINKVA